MKNIHVLKTDKPSRLWTNNLRRRLELDEFPEQHPTNIAKHIYITSDEEIKEDEYYLGQDNNIYCLVTSVNFKGKKIILTTDGDLIKEGVQSIDDEFLEWFVKNPSCESVEVVLNEVSYFIEDNIYKIIIPKEKVVSEYDIMPNIVYGENVGERIKIKAKILSKKEQKQHLIDMMKSDEELGLYEEPKQHYENVHEDNVEKWRNKQETLEEAIKRLCVFKVSKVNDEMRSVNFEIGAKWQMERSYSEEDLKYAYEQGKLYSHICYSRTFENVLEIIKIKKK